MVVHVTNGAYFNEWWMKQTNLTGISFNEAMMSGPVKGNPFDQEFMIQRADYHQVSLKDYKQNMSQFLELIHILNDVDEIILWFGQDAFCQMNLLTIYQTLKFHEYQGIIKTVIFDENQPWEIALHQKPVVVQLNDVASMYQQVLVERRFKACNNQIMNKAVTLFLDLYHQDGRLNQLIRKNLNLNDIDLVKLMMKHSKEEGLSDVQAMEMIRNVRESR